MKLTAVLFGLLCASALVINAVPTPPQDQDDVRGAFITSRPKEKPESSSTTAKPTHRRPRPVTISDTKNNSGTSAVTNKNTNSGTAPVKISKPENKGNNPVNA